MTFDLNSWLTGRKEGCRVVGIDNLLYWKPLDAPLQQGELGVFYDGDYTDVLDMDDPRIVAALAKRKQAETA